jgi:hypothetical protein
MDTGGFSYALERDVKKFNGYLFKEQTVLALPREGSASRPRSSDVGVIY